jgi:glyoxylase-like metal-dependent hydrolase (beta-lactamase superfamily II)/rhodanese-related sulfurtransferase
MQIGSHFTPGLADSSYVLTAGAEALVVDPQRDVDRLLERVRSEGLRVRYVLETHVHNDYVSGAAEIRASTGAEIVGPAGAGYRFPYHALRDGEDVSLDGVRIVALATPGHTPEHVSYLVYERDRDDAVGVFTGGSLIVGNAGRTDLFGDEQTDELTHAQFRSLRRLASLPDATLVLPTHGAGSFCAAGRAQEERSSTIGRERATNPALSVTDESSFVRQQLSGLVAFPRYYAEMAPINRAGAPVVGHVPPLRALSVGELATEVARGATVVDGRDGASFAAQHVPGSVNVPLDETFASYVAWVLPFDAPIGLVVPDGDDAAVREATVQLFRIGREHVVGYLAGGVEAWIAAGRPASRYATLSADGLALEVRRGGSAGSILDVRQQPEWDAGHLDGSTHVFVGELPSRIGDVPRDREITIACATGHRSAIAASLLDREGFDVRLVTPGGIPHTLARIA